MAFQPITILTVGKMKGSSKYLQQGVEEYMKRLKPLVKLSIEEVSEEPETSTRTPDQVKNAEAERIFKRIDFNNNLVISLSEWGESLDSVTFSSKLWGSRDPNQPNRGGLNPSQKPIIFIVGGPLGLSPRVCKDSHGVWSLSPLTFPHQMVRVILLEQIYRSLKIFQNQPYHK